MSCATEMVLLVELDKTSMRACGGWARSGWAPLSFSVRVAGTLAATCKGSRAAALSHAGEVARARRWVVGAEDGASSQEVP